MLQPTRLIVVRHGRTAWNAAGRIQGQLDVPLDDVGHWQAQQLAHALVPKAGGGQQDLTSEPALTAIYSSDLARALATAQAVADRLALHVVTDPALRERGFGRFEGLNFAEIESRWSDDARRWRSRAPDFAPGGGESLAVFSARCVGAVLRMAAAHPGESIAVVAHGGVLDCLYRAATGLALDAPRSWQLANASINRLLFHGEGLVLVGWDDQAHLQAEPAA
ncbi:MAG TPA: histidine phosphatase family protein [Rubrivivax sp.]|nr:histidine phosphatase family protein [Rubrivivax sp.]